MVVWLELKNSFKVWKNYRYCFESFSTIFLFLITLKIESKLHLYFLIVFLAISWSQVYINTLIKFYKKKIIPKTDPKSLEAKKKIDLDLNISSVKKIINKCLNLVTFISINLNLITLYIFIFLIYYTNIYFFSLFVILF